MKLGQKAIDCLKLAAISPPSSDERWSTYNALCEKYTPKVVDRKLTELSRRGYIEYGVSVRTGWLTVNGQKALATGEGIDP